LGKQALGLHIMCAHKFLDSGDEVDHQQNVDVERDSKPSAHSSHSSRLKTFPRRDCNKVFGTAPFFLKKHETLHHKRQEKTAMLYLP